MTAPVWRDLTAQQLATARRRRVLLVEDDDAYVARVRNTLMEASPRAFSLEVVPTLAEAISSLEHHVFDIVLLDLGLPDEHGIRTFEMVRRAAGQTPICIVTSADDPEIAAYTLYLGAADYLVKNASDDLLLHVVGRAISRARPNAGVDELDLPESTHGEPLNVAEPALFRLLVGVYTDIVGLAQRSHYVKDPGGDYRADLRTLATRLGRADASARDALLLHKEAVARRLRDIRPDQDAWVAEARMIALELLAMLVEHYRTLPSD